MNLVMYLVSLSALIVFVLILRAVFKKTVAPRYLYLLWLAVVIRMLIPVSLFSVKLPETIPLPAKAAQTETRLPEEQYTPVPQTEPFTPAAPTEQISPVTPAVPTEPRSGEPVKKEPVSMKNALFIGWIAGSVCMALWFVGSACVYFTKLFKNRRFCKKDGRLRVYLTKSDSAPCLVGPVPAVFLPYAAAQTEETDLIYLHEKTHYRHLDHIWTPVRLLALTVFWWNPLVWAAVLLSRKDAELACDDAVAASLDRSERFTYARTILDSVEQGSVLSVGFSSAPVSDRIRALTRKSRTRTVCLILALFLSLASVGCAFISAEPGTEEKPGTPSKQTEKNPEPQEKLPDPDSARYEIPAEVLSETIGAYMQAGTLPGADDPYPEPYLIKVTGLCTDLWLSMRGNNAESMQVYGRRIPFTLPLQVSGNCSFSLFSVNDAVIIEGGYYEIGTVYAVTPKTEQVIPRGETMSYWLFKDDEGGLSYRRTHNGCANIIQTGGLSEAVSYDDLYSVTGKAGIIDGTVVFGEPDVTVKISEFSDLDLEFERFYHEQYASIEEVFAANRKKAAAQTFTLTDADGWSREKADGMMSPCCADFFDSLLSGNSGIPEYDGLGIKEFRIRRDQSQSTYEAYTFSFTVTGNTLPETLPPGTYEKTVWCLRDVLMLDPGNLPSYSPEPTDAWYSGNKDAIRAVFSLITSRCRWKCEPFGKWETVPVNYIVAQAPDHIMELSEFIEKGKAQFGMTEEEIARIEDGTWGAMGLLTELDGKRYVTEGGIGIGCCMNAKDAGKTKDGSLYVDMQFYADPNALLPSHLVRYTLTSSLAFLGCEVLSESPYPPFGLMWSLFTLPLHYSLFTIHSSPFTLHFSLFPIPYSLFTLHSSLSTFGGINRNEP